MDSIVDFSRAVAATTDQQKSRVAMPGERSIQRMLSKSTCRDGLPGCNSFMAIVGSALDVILRECFSFVVSVRSTLPTDPPLLLLPKLRIDIDRGRCPVFPGMMKVDGWKRL